MNDASHASNERFVGNWMWLFPAAYLGHIVEEDWAGFNDWIARVCQVESSDSYFLYWNFLALLGMAVGVCLVLRTRSYR
jgi:hypothetical protein